jgi:hypothetical protein
MTGPEHYAAAEALLAQVKAARASLSRRPDPQTITDALAEAQIHATLAAAAAWNNVAGTPTISRAVAA